MLLRRLARPLLASVFVVQGIDTLRHPESRTKTANALVQEGQGRLPDQYAEKLPADPATVVRANAVAQVAGGTLLAFGKLPRVSAAVLAVTVVPATVTEQDFWNEQDPATKAAKRAAFLKDVGLLGGLLIAAADTEGKPSVGWRGRRAARRTATAVSTALPFGTDTSSTGDSLRKHAQDAAGRASAFGAVAASKGGELAETVQRHGPEWAETAKERGIELAEVAKKRGAELAEVARDRGPELAETAKDRGASLAEIAKKRGADFAEVAKDRGPELAETAKDRSANWAEIAKQRRAELTELAKDRGPELTELARDRGNNWALLAKKRGAELAEVAKDRGPELAETAKDRSANWAEIAKQRRAELTELARERSGEFTATGRGRGPALAAKTRGRGRPWRR
ncbi:DoxX family membrane protein [Nocardia callitridis]|uniref:DoxX family protein n=1 Tax=Nocardia callitridis TaxID=648753 RepID=A0ABP9L5I2_9NOCA